jgi:hypothetical protein
VGDGTGSTPDRRSSECASRAKVASGLFAWLGWWIMVLAAVADAAIVWLAFVNVEPIVEVWMIRLGLYVLQWIDLWLGRPHP